MGLLIHENKNSTKRNNTHASSIQKADPDPRNDELVKLYSQTMKINIHKKVINTETALTTKLYKRVRNLQWDMSVSIEGFYAIIKRIKSLEN